jgi:hypothetical protein
MTHGAILSTEIEVALGNDAWKHLQPAALTFVNVALHVACILKHFEVD